MKKLAISMMSVGLCGWALHAHAQSSVTLYGIVDAGVAYVHNSGGASTQIRFSSSNLSGSEWGLKGQEDLGGGLAAVFTLENGFDMGSGQLQPSGRMFGRQAFVGVTGARIGTLTLGRQYDPVTDVVQPLTGDQFSGTFAPPGDFDNYDDSARFNNAVKWVSPTWAGFTGELMYAFGGVAGATGSGAAYSGALGYVNGPLSLGAGVTHLDNGNAAASARGTSAADSLFNSSVNAAYATARSVTIARAGGQVVLGPVTTGAAYSFTEYAADASSSFNRSEKFNNASLFALWQITPAVQAIAGYNYTASSGDSSAKYHQFNLGVDYSLSKRTDVYAMAGYTHASGQNGQGAAQAVVGSYDIDAGRNSQALAIVGLRQKF
ncbi:porin [Burkholderia guangdongensis]|uniref:porin n=1 Tax=Burkholderia guangdongensis TaxID=1792500 RepID=UPI0015C6C484|nr:porin [Burkholderia guangdongensis]